MILEDIDKFSKSIHGNLKFDYELKNLNWFNIGGKTKIFFKPEDLKELREFLKLYNQRGKIFLLGAGSNVLFSDDTFDGVVIKLGKRFSNISLLNDTTIIAGCSVLDKKLSMFSVDNNISGLEFLSCIPGTVGGGIRMNSGCYGTEFKDITHSIQAIDFKGNILTFPSNKIEFKYRGSNLPKDLIFLSATFKGILEDKSFIQERIHKFKETKEISQPSKIKTSGSTFKNPTNDLNLKVWELIKKSVPKDIKFGDASISNHHSNFFVNNQNAKSKDMLKLINYVKTEVKKKFNIDLELEVVIVK